MRLGERIFDVDGSNDRAVYLCWRAMGYDQWDSLYNAIVSRVQPADWAFLYDNDGGDCLPEGYEVL